MDSSVMWMLLVFFTGLLGFIIYIFSRPHGDLVTCGDLWEQTPRRESAVPALREYQKGEQEDEDDDDE